MALPSAGGRADAQFRNREFTETELEYARGLITTITLSDYQIETLLRTDTDTMEEMISTVTTAIAEHQQIPPSEDR